MTSLVPFHTVQLLTLHVKSDDNENVNEPLEDDRDHNEDNEENENEEYYNCDDQTMYNSSPTMSNLMIMRM